MAGQRISRWTQAIFRRPSSALPEPVTDEAELIAGAKTIFAIPVEQRNFNQVGRSYLENTSL